MNFPFSFIPPPFSFKEEGMLYMPAPQDHWWDQLTNDPGACMDIESRWDWAYRIWPT